MTKRTKAKRRFMKWDCPDGARLHTPEPVEPSDYIGWCDWAEGMAKTHKQERCPTCGLAVIWVKK